MSSAIQPHWYMLNNIGMATLCAGKEDAEACAAEYDQQHPRMAPHRAVQLVDAAELDKLTARLEAGKTVWRQDQDRIAELMTHRDELLKGLQSMAAAFHPPMHELDGADDEYLLEWFPEWTRARNLIAKHQPTAAPSAKGEPF